MSDQIAELDDQRGRVGYEAFGNATGGDLPMWDALDGRQRDAWNAAADAYGVNATSKAKHKS